MTTTLLTPMDRGKARQAGASLWRKQLLPIGEISYEGRKIAFTREYLAGLVKAFTDKAYDAVSFQFPAGDGKHNNKIEQRRGTVRGLEMTDDGLDVIVAASPVAAEHLAEYPDIGISARIVEDYERADGKFFPAAIQHVLATLDPRLTGMRPWQAIDAANDEGDVIDLTALEYATQTGTADAVPAVTTPPETAPETKETGMALTPDQEARLGKLLDLPEDQFAALLAPPEKPAEGEPGTEGGEQLTDAELEALVASLEDVGDVPDGGDAKTAEPKELLPAGASLTAEAQAAIDLANARADETSMALKRVTTKLAVAAYESERDTFARTYGIPPRITDLARGLLEGEGRVVELANGKSADAGAIVREVLKEVGKTVKMLDLTAELGSPLDGGAEAAAAAEHTIAEERRELVSLVRSRTGI